MKTPYVVLATDAETGTVNVQGPFSTESAAHEYAQKWAEVYYGDHDVTWYEHVGLGRYHVGHLLNDGTRSAPLVRITVEEGTSALEDDV